VTVDGRPLDLDVCRTGPRSLSLIVGGRSYDVGVEKANGGYDVRLRGRHIGVGLADGYGGALGVPAAQGPSRITAPMPGKIVSVRVAPDDRVEPGAPVVVMEAMKMQNELCAQRGGRVARVLVEAGQTVEGGALLIELD
jgi:biotin carboxyl carrier protein